MTPKISAVGVVCSHEVAGEDALSTRDDMSRFVSQKKSLKLMNRASQLAIAAGRLATRALDAKQLEAAGLFLGVGMSGGELSSLSGMLSESLDARGQLDLLLMGERGLSRVNPLLSFHVLNNMPLCHLSIELGIRGAHGAFYCDGAAAGLLAIERAAQSITRQESQVALAGGADSLLDTINLALTTHTKPSEGAAILVFSGEGDIAWIGLRQGFLTQEDALRALAPSTKMIFDADANEPFGDTQAAAASLFVARAIVELRMSQVGTQAAIVARDLGGYSMAVLERCQ